MNSVSELAISVKGLRKVFNGKVAVNGVDIAMPRGQVWGFLGPNGSGKTTTIRMLCGLLKPSAGEGRCLGYDILTESSKIKIKTGYMTQKFSFWEDLTIRENLEFVARMYNLDDRDTTVRRTLDSLGLTQRQHQLCSALSGGWKQRLALAAVTMHRPQLLLLDEPTAGVDPQARRDFWDQIHELAASGLTILVSTHYMDEAERCDRIVYLAHGEIITQGTVSQVIESSGLITYAASGDGVRSLLSEIRQQPGVEHAAYFGAALHVSGHDAQQLAHTIGQFSQVAWKKIEPSLEDAFIALMQKAGVDRRNF